MKSVENETQELVESLKKIDPERDTTNLTENLTKGFEMRSAFFNAAGIDPEIVTKFIDALEKGGSIEQLCTLLAPEMKKVFDVEFDTENAESGKVKFKRSEKNLLEDFGIDNTDMAQLLTLFTKYYQDEKEEDGEQLDELVVKKLNTFLALAPKTGEES